MPAELVAERVVASLRLAPQSLPQVPVVQRSSLVQPVVPPSSVLTPPISAVALGEEAEQPLVQRASLAGTPSSPLLVVAQVVA